MGNHITTQLPAELEFVHTYSGSGAMPPHPPIYTPDAMRCRPTLIFGADDSASAKKQMLITQAYMDACKDRPVIFIDGNPARPTLDKLFYWNHVLARKPFYALFPTREMDYLCHTWNPFTFPEKNSDALTAILFDGYVATLPRPEPLPKMEPSPKTPKTNPAPKNPVPNPAPAPDLQPQRQIFFDLVRSLHRSGRAYCFNDIRAILESTEIRRHVATLLDEKTGADYRAWLARFNAAGPELTAFLPGLVNYLHRFSLWSINSYHPQINLARAIETSATVYIGLPVDVNPVLMTVLGKMLVHQLNALAISQSEREPMDRPPFAVTIDPASLFLDDRTGDRIYALRPSSVMLSLGFRDVTGLAAIGAHFQGEVRLNTANLFMFNPNHSETANWFSEFSQSAKTEPEAADGEPSRASLPASLINGEIEPSSVDELTGSQCFYWPSHGLEQPIKLQAPFLFDPPPIPQCRYHRLPYAPPREKEGLNLWSVLLDETSPAAATANGSKTKI